MLRYPSLIQRTLSGCAIVAAVLLWSSPVHAQKVANIPGGACIATNDNVATVTSHGAAQNQTSSWMALICPAKRLNIPTQGFTNKFHGRVFVVDRNPSTDIWCRAVSKNPYGLLITGSWVSSSGSSSSSQTLNIPEINDSYTFSHFFLQCWLPAATSSGSSRIQMYQTLQDH